MRILPALAVSLIVALVGCSTSTTTANSNPNKGPSNSDLEQMVKSKLASDQRTQDSKIDVSADADKSEVTLKGTVYTEAARMRAVDLAKSAQPGLQVVDKIDVKPGDMPKSAYNEDLARDERAKAKANSEKIGDSINDAWIHSKIAAKLIGDSATPARKINIDVVNGVVTLRGMVDTAEAKQEAGRIAKDTDDVKGVNNMLKVGIAKG